MLLVFANHLWGWPRGGFVGVDVFFVISGFLITGILLRERQRTGRISFREFYARRMRRIFPMATLVLVVTVALGYLLLFQSEAEETLIDALWAFVFLENWHLISVGTDYFHAADSMSAVQQYWSLSVEEQFYLVWPAALVVLWWLAGRLRRSTPGSRRARHSRTVPVAALSLVTAASFAWAVYLTAQEPTAAYFSTATRVWELGVGALLAFAAPAFAALGARLRWLLVRVGLLLIATGALLLTPDSAFPGPWALLPVVGTALVLASGTEGQAPTIRILTNRYAGYLGKVSYSFYLWHLPVIVFAFVLAPPSIGLYLVVIAVTLALAAASFHFIEEPVRRSTWLSRRAAPTVPASRSWRTHLRHAASVGAALMLVSTLVTLTWHNAGTRLSTSSAPVDQIAEEDLKALREPPPAVNAGNGFTVVFPDAQGIHEAHLRAALQAGEWPELQIGDEWDDWARNANSGNCSTAFGEARMCSFGSPDASKKAVILGDSQAAAWFPVVRPTLEAEGYYIEVYYLVGCAAADVAIHEHFPTAPVNQNCEDFRAEAVGRVASLAPELTIVTSFWRQAELLMSGATGAAAEEEWRAGVVRTLEAFSPHTSRLVLLDSPQGSESIKKCKTAGSAPADCEREIQTLSQTVSRLNEEATTAVNESLGNQAVRHQSVEQWFCVDGRCPSLLGDLPIYTDGIHIAPIYATYLAPLAGPVVVSGQQPG